MPRLSIFTPCGQLKMSSQPSHIEVFYKLLPQLYGSELDFTVIPSYNESKLYAEARMLALMLVEVEHAGNQAFPMSAYELLPLLEIDYLLTPGPKDTVPTRQKAVAAQMKLAGGAIASNVVALMRLLAGSNFLAYVPNPAGQGNQLIWPTHPGNGPGAFKDDRVVAKRLQLVDPVSATGAPLWVAYQALDPSSVPSTQWGPGLSFPLYELIVPTLAAANGFIFQCIQAGTSGATQPAWPSAPGLTVTDGSVIWQAVSTIAPALQTGDVVVLDAGNTLRMDKVTVSAVSNMPPAGQNVTPGFLYFQATFGAAHDIGAPMTTGTVPYWWSTLRLNWIVLQAAGALDAPTRTKLDNMLAKVLKGPDTWAIVQAATTTQNGGTVGPLSAGQAIGTVPLGSFTFANSN